MMDDMGDTTSRRSQPSKVAFFFKRISQAIQIWLDKSAPHPLKRWVLWLAITLVFFLRTIIMQGWYIITYALAIYELNLLLAFLTPKIDPALSVYEDDGVESELPMKQSDEFRPFIRRLPEFKFWLSAVKATLLALFATLFQIFNVPVFWPILVLYFITLFCITMKRQIKHMIKYRYIPFSMGKPKFGRTQQAASEQTQAHQQHMASGSPHLAGTVGGGAPSAMASSPVSNLPGAVYGGGGIVGPAPNAAAGLSANFNNSQHDSVYGAH